MQPEPLLEEMKANLPPVDRCLQALATERDLPSIAIGTCLLKIDEAGPALRALLERAAGGASLSEDEKMLVFRGLYVLGSAGDSLSFQPLLRLLRRPNGEVDDLLGDAITQDLARIAAGVFDGDAAALFDAIADTSIDDFIRESLFGAATFLAWEGRIAPEEMRRFLLRFEAERLADDGDESWVGWVAAIALLGLRELAPLAYAALEDGRVCPTVMNRADFERMLQQADRAPDDVGRFERKRLGYIGDVLEALEWTRRPEDPDWLPLTDWGAPAPFINAFREVGRNDPCLCGSGKKFKKCCLDEVS